MTTPPLAESPTWWGRCLDYWLRIDLRSLGLFRILLAVVLLWNLGRRWWWFDTLYTSSGVFPADSIPHHGDWLANLGFWFSWYANPLVWIEDWPWAVRAFFALTAVCYVMLLLGIRTRLATVLSLVLFAWLSHRNRHVTIGADYVMGSMLLWSLFLPLGARFSLDGVRARLKAGVRLPSGPSNNSGEPWLAAPRISARNIAALGVVLQIGLIYFCTAWMKSGESWWGKGTAIYYVLYIEQSVYPLAEWMRDLPLGFLRFLTWATLAVEYAALPLLLLPWGQPAPRRLAIVSLVGLHVGIALIVDAGLFSYVMFACFALLPRDEDWRAARALLRHFSRPATVYYDDSCGICTKSCEALAIVDRFGKLSFIGNSNTPAYRHPVPVELTESTVVVCDDRTGRQSIKAVGAAAALRGLPLPFRAWCWIGWPIIRELTNAAYDTFAANRHRVSAWLGLTACGIPRAPQTPGVGREAGSPGPTAAGGYAGEYAGEAVIGRHSWWGKVLATLLLASILVDAAYFTFIAPSLAALTDPTKEPPLVRVAALPQRLAGVSQRWNMFSPDVSQYDLWWVWEAQWPDGRQLDLLRGGLPSSEQPQLSERLFNSTMGEYLKHGLTVEGDYASAESQAVAKALCRYLAREITRVFRDDPPQTIRIYRLRQQAPPADGTKDQLVSDVLLVASYDLATQKFQPSNDLTYVTIRRRDGTLTQEGPSDWRNGQREGRWTTYLDDGQTVWSYGTYRDGALTGPAVIWNIDEEGLREEGNLVDGKKEGYWVSYHPDGWIAAAGRYQEGKRDGVWERYSASGRRLRQVTYQADVLDGPAMTWHPLPAGGLPERIWSRGYYRNGRPDGEWTEWAKDGKPARHGVYANGSPQGTWTRWIYGRAYQQNYDGVGGVSSSK